MVNKRFIGGMIGSIIGFLIGASIPSQIGIGLSFFQRMTGSVILEDPQGLVISLGYALIGGALLGAAGTFIGSNFDKNP